MKFKTIFSLLLFLGLIFICLWAYQNLYNSEKINPKPKYSTEHLSTATSLNPKQRVLKKLQEIGLDKLPDKISMVAIKSDRRLEVYCHQSGGLKFLCNYPFTAFSGGSGPKLKQGDKQIPEGIYSIEYLNPNSKFHLSMKVNYPNKFDRKMAEKDGRSDLGGDIFIHGRAVTIGCIPIGDEAIEELYLLAEHCLNKGIEIIISPEDFRKDSYRPNIVSVNWEDELYDSIERELKVFR